MKIAKRYVLVLLSLVMFAGCVTKNPAYTPSQPISVSNPVYVPDTNKLNSTFGTISTVNAATAPADPYAPLVNLGIELGLGAATIISGMFASSQNKKAALANASAQHLATVLPDNMVAQAVNSAPTPAIASAVAGHLALAPNTSIPSLNS